MMTARSLRSSLCACLLLAPLATLAAQEMKDDGSFSISAAYGVAFPADRTIDGRTVSTDLGFVSDAADSFPAMIATRSLRFALCAGRFGVGYSIFGFRPELSVGYRMANIKDQDDQSVTSIDVIASVYYDVDTGSDITPYIGIGGGMSNVTVKEGNTKTVWALAFQGAAGIGYALTEDLTLTLGYRLTGTMEATFEDKSKLGMALGHNVELGIRYSF
jgi:opacity protein-like surface antigen